MSAPIPPDEVETLVGARRHRTKHIGRAVTARRTVYMLHSRECRDERADLTECPYARASDNGIDPSEWPPDTAVYVIVGDGHLTPQRFPSGDFVYAGSVIPDP